MKDYCTRLWLPASGPLLLKSASLSFRYYLEILSAASTSPARTNPKLLLFAAAAILL
jgi:hypothetical protein